MHVTITHGREGLDAEEEVPEESGRAQIGDAIGVEMEKTAEQDVEDQEERDDRGEQARPAHHHGIVIEVLKYFPGDALTDDVAQAHAHEPRAARSRGARLSQRVRWVLAHLISGTETPALAPGRKRRS